MLTERQEQSLTGGGDSFDHYHSSDRAPTHDTLARLHQLAKQTLPSGVYQILEKDDIVMVSTANAVTLPLSRNGQEYEVVMTGTSPFYINMTSPDTLYGETSVLVEQTGTALRFKAITGGWILI